MDLDAAVFESKDENARKVLKGVEDLTYLRRAEPGIRAQLRGERYRNGEKTHFPGSSIRQSIKS